MGLYSVLTRGFDDKQIREYFSDFITNIMNIFNFNEKYTNISDLNEFSQIIITNNSKYLQIYCEYLSHYKFKCFGRKKIPPRTNTNEHDSLRVRLYYRKRTELNSNKSSYSFVCSLLFFQIFTKTRIQRFSLRITGNMTNISKYSISIKSIVKKTNSTKQIKCIDL